MKSTTTNRGLVLLSFACTAALVALPAGCGNSSSDDNRLPSPAIAPEDEAAKRNKRKDDVAKDVEGEAKKEGDGAAKFARVMKHILHWEGGCSDHPADAGGRTFKGITTGRARQNGWTTDVCEMPNASILRIYREDYWSMRAREHPWPLDLAVMNTEVNSGGGKAQEFLARMKRAGVEGSPRGRAAWFVEQQSAYYQDIASRRPDQRVFLQGWMNRSNYMQDVIAGKRSNAESVAELVTLPNALPDMSLDTVSFEASGSAKAYAGPFTEDP